MGQGDKMGKYVFIYHGGGNGNDGTMEDWVNWFTTLGDKVIDPGNPFNTGGQAVHKGGVMPVEGTVATGYTVVKADSMEEATEMAKGCPLVGADDAAVAVYEALPM